MIKNHLPYASYNIMVNIEAKNMSLLSKHEMEAGTLGKFKSNKMLELAIYNSQESKGWSIGDLERPGKSMATV